jgi:hypothetical protein
VDHTPDFNTTKFVLLMNALVIELSPPSMVLANSANLSRRLYLTREAAPELYVLLTLMPPQMENVYKQSVVHERRR